MDDGFNFGEPGRKWSEARLRPRARAARERRASGHLLALVGGAIVVGAAVFAFMTMMKEAGEEVAGSQATAIGQVGVAQDAQAQLDLKNAAMSATALYAEGAGDLAGPSYQVASPQALGELDGSVTFTEGPSTGPGVVSVQAGTTAWAAAEMSGSGTCLWVKIVDGQQSFGTGTPCTGQAAMGAAEPSW